MYNIEAHNLNSFFQYLGVLSIYPWFFVGAYAMQCLTLPSHVFVIFMINLPFLSVFAYCLLFLFLMSVFPGIVF